MSYTPDYFLGVDPGKDGGVAVLDRAGNPDVLFPMPVTPDGRVDSFGFAAGLRDVDWYRTKGTGVCVEHVWAMPGQGVVSMFTFGRAAGQAVGALEVLLGAKAHEVAPQTWQRGLWDPSDEGDPKAAARKFVEGRWPDLDLRYSKTTRKPSAKVKGPHPGLVDALCLAEYARRNWALLAGGGKK